MTNSELIRLANSDNLSLVLRHQWQKKTGWDPYNIAREMRKMGFGVLSSAIAIIGFFIAALVNTQINLSDYPRISSGIGVVIFLMGFLGFVLIATHQQMPSDVRGFGEKFELLLLWAKFKPSDYMTECDLEYFRLLAKNILVKEAKEVLQIQALPREEQLEAGIAAAYSTHTSLLKKKYDVLQDLGLVSGGYKPFYAFAQKELDEEAKKAAETSTA